MLWKFKVAGRSDLLRYWRSSASLYNIEKVARRGELNSTMKAGISLCVNGKYIHIEWPDNLAPDTLTRLFVPWQVKTGNNSSTISCNIKVLALQKGFSVEAPSFPKTSCSTIPELFSTLEFMITEEARALLDPFLQIHATVIDLMGAGAMLVARHGTGKTTLALTAVSSGFRALTDEVGVITDDDNSAVGFPRPFRIKNDSLYLSPPIVPQDCYSYPVSENLSYVCFEKYYVSETKLRYIFFPVRRPGKTVLEAIGDIDALRQLLPHGFNFYKSPDGRTGDLITLIPKLKIFNLLYQDHWNAIAHIYKLMNQYS